MIDTNELRAAAARLSNEAYNGVEHAEMYEQPLQRARDAILLARAYLAELEPNDYTDAARPSYWRGNDDGVRRACERITAILDGKDNGSGVCGEPLETLRRRLLDERPADDGELLTLGWLKTTNAEFVDLTWQEPHPGDIRIGYLYLIGEKSRGRWRFCVYMDGNGIGKIETRGDLRRLCCALGIELKEGGE